ncbi:hypothetical protein QPX23_05950 [Corynebacterium pseudodiphtheriticum]|uniref:Uncharacterized protein n=1 Tax=Corynebacterium pseudodiphtheriticum TaxID=37637 RepID=A0ABT7FXC8_9CORY|nr:hypothetical protein [Corynebacterium pseudodiphtheriticum]MDK4290266.1 hypothetical protein [Corynebacterium pseudodiphtheriticum]
MILSATYSSSVAHNKAQLSAVPLGEVVPPGAAGPAGACTADRSFCVHAASVVSRWSLCRQPVELARG